MALSATFPLTNVSPDVKIRPREKESCHFLFSNTARQDVDSAGKTGYCVFLGRINAIAVASMVDVKRLILITAL